MSLQKCLTVWPLREYFYYTKRIRIIKYILSNRPHKAKKLDIEASSTLVWLGVLWDFKKILLRNQFAVNVIHPLQLALLTGNVKSVALLLRNGSKVEGSNRYVTALVWSLLSNNNVKVCKKLIKLLFSYNFDAQYSSAHGENILLIFIVYFMHKCNKPEDALEIVETLVSCGVSVNRLNENGWTPLFHAIRLRHSPVAEFLIKEEANRNKIYSPDFRLKNFPLFLAGFMSNTHVMSLILKNGGDVNTRIFGRTLLHSACEELNPETLNFLLQNGANLNERNDEYRTPFFLLIGKKNGGDKNYFVCLNYMVKEMAKRKYLDDNSVSASDMELIQVNGGTRELFIKFKKMLDVMEITEFYATYTYSDVLKMSEKDAKKFAKLTRNNEFLAKFEENLHKFSCYECDLRKNLQKAILIRDEELMVEFKLEYLFGNCLQDLIRREISKYLNLKDIPW